MTPRLTLAWAAGASIGLAVGILAGGAFRDAVDLTYQRRAAEEFLRNEGADPTPEQRARARKVQPINHARRAERLPERRSGVGTGTTATPAVIVPQIGIQREAHGPHCAEDCARRRRLHLHLPRGEAMSGRLHIPGRRSGLEPTRPICGALGRMSIDYAGLRTVPIANAGLVELSQVHWPEADCIRCRRAFRRKRGIALSWLMAYASGKDVPAAEGCTYVGRAL